MGLFSDSINAIGNNLGLDVPISKELRQGAYRGESVFSLDNSVNKSERWRGLAQEYYGRPSVETPDDLKSFAAVYAAVVWVYVSNWVISSSLSSLPLRFYTGRKQKPEEIENDRLIELWNEPNEFESDDEFLEMIATYLETTGNNYMEKYGIVGGLPVKLFNLEPYYTTIKPHPIKKVDVYIWNNGMPGFKHNFYPQQIIHTKYSNPNNPYYGMGAIKPLENTLLTEIYRESYNRAYFENEARPDVILKHNADITKGIRPLQLEDRRQLASSWHKGFGGPKKNRLPVVLPSGMDISLLTEARQDMEFREMEKSLRERIFAAHGVPPAMAGIYEYANYANAKEQIRIFWTTTMPPKCKRISNSLNRGLIKPYNEAEKRTGDSRYWCEFDMDFIPALEETPKEREERLSRMLERAGIDIGEYRQGLGFKDKKEFKDIDNKRVIAANLINAEDALSSMENLQETEAGSPDSFHTFAEAQTMEGGKK